jgi:hypothetical protein
MKLLTGITPQEGFPHEDLTADNADLLSLMLANKGVRVTGHEQAEGFWFYWAAHRAMLEAGRHLDSAERVAAFNHGITTYEAIGILMRPTVDLGEIMDAERIGPVGLNVGDLNDLFGLFEQAEDGFKAMPNTAGVVNETAEYAYPHMGSYAIYGAALARALEIEVV